MYILFFFFFWRPTKYICFVFLAPPWGDIQMIICLAATRGEHLRVRRFSIVGYPYVELNISE